MDDEDELDEEEDRSGSFEGENEREPDEEVDWSGSDEGENEREPDEEENGYELNEDDPHQRS